MNGSPEKVRVWLPVPREHGAWGMLAQPFLAALVVVALRGEGRHWMGAIPSMAAAALVFLIREPLLVLARQKWVWRDAGGKRPETAVARRWVAIEALALLASGAWLLAVWPVRLAATLLLVGGVGAAALTGLAVYVTIRNKQRSIWFQGLSAAGLSASGLAACLAVTGRVPEWGWWWWGLHAAHFLAGILVVHVRLEARIAARRGRGMPPEFFKARQQTAIVQAVFLAAGLAMLAMGKEWYAGAAVASAAWHLYNLYAARTPAAVMMPMTSVGKRALAASIVFTIVAGAGAVLS